MLKEYQWGGGIDTDITLKDDDNLIIKGNNLIALSTLLKRYEGKVKCIYIDPPYNTGNDSFNYNDSFNHSTWLVFMKNRLELAKKLLSDDGLIFINLDHNEAHYCKVLMDSIFGRNNFINEIIWSYTGGTDREKGFNRKHDNILLFSKDESYNFNNLYVPFSESTLRRFNKYDEFGKRYKENKLSDGRITRTYMKEEGKKMSDIWEIPIVNKTYLESQNFKGQKPEELLKNIISCSTNENDLILDFHLGSGTTAAVAHKMGRRYIGVEQMDYIETITVERMKKVIDGEQGGISKSVNWQGGGSFVYCELLEDTATLISSIQLSDENNIFKIKEKIYLDDRIIPYITKEELKNVDEEFESLTLEEKKQALIKLIDKNKLYVNYSDIEDESYNISKSDKKFTKSFYKES